MSPRKKQEFSITQFWKFHSNLPCKIWWPKEPRKVLEFVYVVCHKNFYKHIKIRRLTAFSGTYGQKTSTRTADPLFEPSWRTSEAWNIWIFKTDESILLMTHKLWAFHFIFLWELRYKYPPIIGSGKENYPGINARIF